MRQLPWRDRPVVHYRVTDLNQRIILVTGFGFMFLIESTSFADPKGRSPGAVISTWAILTAIALVAARFAVAATLILRDDGVKLREFHRTRKIHWTAIDGFVAETRPYGYVGYRRRILGIRLAGGRTIWTSINCKPAATGQTELDGDASFLNLELRKLREARAREPGTPSGIV